MAEIKDANQLRSQEFKKLAKRPMTWVLVVLGIVVITGIGFLFDPVFGVLGFIISVIGGPVFVWLTADQRAAEAFYDSYAESRGLSREGSGHLEECTPLLKKGDSRRANQIFTGPLEEGLEGTLALYTYTEESTDSDGNTQEKDFPFTLILVDLPETIEYLPELLVQKKSGFKALEKVEDAFRGKHERVTLESEAMRDRYEVFVGKEHDAVWVRRLFSPSFIVWLTDSPPKKFAFELVDGKLCAFVPKHRDSAEGLDEIVAVGCEVARRLREEATG